ALRQSVAGPIDSTKISPCGDGLRTTRRTFHPARFRSCERFWPTKPFAPVISTTGLFLIIGSPRTLIGNGQWEFRNNILQNALCKDPAVQQDRLLSALFEVRSCCLT